MRAWLAAILLLALPVPAFATDVVTQHNDVQRTGWNPAETILNASNVKAGSFGLQRTVALDDQVDAQPLVLASFNGHTVVYVVSENNTVYAIDAATGTILLQRNLGTPVGMSIFGNCNNNAPHVGITATPVIDRAAGKLYVVSYTASGTTASYQLHALALTTLADSQAPVTISATHTLSDGSTYTFNAAKMRQRAALLEANGNIYIAFTSFCDTHSSVTRGMVLGYHVSSLSPLPANYLVDSIAPSATSNFFLSTIWQSGNGLAAGSNGTLYFATGNSRNGTYSTTTNLMESVVSLSGDLTTVKDFFTPSNVNSMNDEDLNAGGVMLIPPQAGTSTLLATVLGKDGRLFLLDQKNLGKFGTTNHVLQTVSAGACWCAEAYYKGPTGQGRVVTSTGSRVVIWRIVASPLGLTKYATLPAISTGQDPGFFTAVSANGNASNSIIIWAVSRPTSASPANVTLYAFNVANSALLFSANAGTWPNVTGNANIMPTVANGQVFVASFKQLAIFGVGGKAAPLAAAPLAIAQTVTSTPGAPNEVSGWIDGINGNLLTIRKRDGSHMTVDDTQAQALDQLAPLGMELAITAFGATDANGVLQAQTVVRAKDNILLWPPDL